MLRVCLLANWAARLPSLRGLCAVHEIDGCQQERLGGIRNRRMDFEDEDSREESAE